MMPVIHFCCSLFNFACVLDSSNVLKYLHPGDPASDMESTSEAPTDQSIAGSTSRQVKKHFLHSLINTGNLNTTVYAIK